MLNNYNKTSSTISWQPVFFFLQNHFLTNCIYIKLSGIQKCLTERKSLRPARSLFSTPVVSDIPLKICSSHNESLKMYSLLYVLKKDGEKRHVGKAPHVGFIYFCVNTERNSVRKVHFQLDFILSISCSPKVVTFPLWVALKWGHAATICFLLFPLYCFP